MVKIGAGAGRDGGYNKYGCPAVGNSLEVVEAINTLRGEGSRDFLQLVLALSAQLLYMAGKGDRAFCEKLAEDAVLSGSALSKLREMIIAQGGDASYIDEPCRFPKALLSKVISPSDGYIQNGYGVNRTHFRGPRGSRYRRKIDHSAGLVLNKTGDEVKR